jgi:hypothetical protein
LVRKRRTDAACRQNSQGKKQETSIAEPMLQGHEVEKGEWAPI